MLTPAGIQIAKQYNLHEVNSTTLAKLRPYFTEGRFDKVFVSQDGHKILWHVINGPYTVQEILDNIGSNDYLGSSYADSYLESAYSSTETLIDPVGSDVAFENGSDHSSDTAISSNGSVQSGYSLGEDGTLQPRGRFHDLWEMVEWILGAFPPPSVAIASEHLGIARFGLRLPASTVLSIPGEYTVWDIPFSLDRWWHIGRKMAFRGRPRSRRDIKLLHKLSGYFAYISVLARDINEMRMFLLYAGPLYSADNFIAHVRRDPGYFQDMECFFLGTNDALNAWISASFKKHGCPHVSRKVTDCVGMLASMRAVDRTYFKLS